MMLNSSSVMEKRAEAEGTHRTPPSPPATPAKMNAHFRWMKDPSVVAREVAVFLRTASA